MSVSTTTNRMTVPRFRARKNQGQPLALLTAYDAPTAILFDRAGVDALLIGDSLGAVVQGKSSTLAVTMAETLYHAEIVARVCQSALIIADLPFLSYQVERTEAVRNAGLLVKQAGVAAVKLEGGTRVASTIEAIVNADIPVMAHIGLTPQSVHRLGGYKVQRDHDTLLADARAVEAAGAFAIVLEAMPSTLAQQVTETVSIPTIGIGAGPHCDGQILVWTDAFGLTDGHIPKFVKQFANIRSVLETGVRAYLDATRSRQFPDTAHSYD